MFPPTPTFLPPGTPFFTIPSSVSLWGAAPYTIQTWNMLPGEVRTIIQAVLLIAMLIANVYIIMRFARGGVAARAAWEDSRPFNDFNFDE